ncbi:hypothetical protein OROMI_020663 [Orobanche minor]
MAKSKYEYVKSFETDDEIKLPHIIIVLVDGCDFRRFSEVHEFEKPNDKKALDLMNECAKDVLEKHPDVIFSYGYSDEYRKQTSTNAVPGLHMSPVEYRTILRYCLMIPLFPIDEVCLDTFGEHAVHCRELPGFKYRHDLVRDVLADIFRRAGVSVKKEAPVNFLTDPHEGRSTLRPADVLVYGWEGGKHACVDLTGVSPLVGLRDGGFSVGQTDLKATSSKVVKHEKACFDNQHAFIPFAFDTFGFLSPEAVDLLQRVQRLMHSNDKMHSVVVSYFSAIYTSKWKEFFPMKELKYSPSFRSRVICCPTAEDLQAYLLWKRNECHLSNQYDTCYWELIKSGKSEKEAKEMLKAFLKKDKNELLFQQFNINYNDIPKAFRQGTCTLKTECKDDDGCPLKRPRRKIKMVHPKNIASKSFWSAQFVPMKELGQFNEDLNKVRPRLKYVTSFQYDSNLPLSNWIVICIDGCHFHSYGRFTEVHEFEKPNDAEALNLMNSCAAVVLEEFKDIVFAYGVSDEYSFVLKKDSQLYQRDASDIVSAIVSFFTSMYIKKWTKFFPHKELECLPYFDGRAVCYPSRKILLDYLAWRQVDCHINNQYNTCFWTLVKSGKSNSDAQNYLKGTKAQDKSDLVDQLSGIINYYSGLPPMFRLGSSVYWDKEKTKMVEDEEGIVGKSGKIVVRHCDIIKRGFWIAHPEILGAFKGSTSCSGQDNSVLKKINAHQG